MTVQFTDPRIARRALGMREPQIQGEIEPYRRLHVVRLGENRGLPRWGCHLLRHLGQYLVVLGRRLERYGAPQPSLGQQIEAAR